MPNKIVDTSGMRCPLPLLAISNNMDKMKKGEKLEIISDDPAVCNDVEAYCKTLKYQIEEIKKENNKIIIILTK